MSDTVDFIRSRLDQMIDLSHQLPVLASRMPWQEVEASVTHLFSRRVSSGRTMVSVELFGSTASLVDAGVSKAGRPRQLLQLMISLPYLKYAFKESVEGVVERWAETPAWQYLPGLEYFEHRWPYEPTAIRKFCRLMGKKGVDELVTQTINVAVTLKLVAKRNLARVIFNSTGQQKVMTHPTDSKLLEMPPDKLVEVTKQAGLDLKHIYPKKSQGLRNKAGIENIRQRNHTVGVRASIDNTFDGQWNDFVSQAPKLIGRPSRQMCLTY